MNDDRRDIPESLDAWLDEIVTDAGFEDLDAWLAADPAHARRLLDLTIVHRGIPSALDACDLPHGAAPERRNSTPAASSRAVMVGAIAAAVLFAAAAFAIIVGVIGDPSAPDRAPSDEPVATLVQATGVVIADETIFTPGDEPSRGVYLVESGTAEFLLRGGATVEMVGPAQVSIEGESLLQLERGHLRARVAPGGALTVEAGNLRIEDLGTAFNVIVDDAGVGVVVTEGSVRATRLDGPVDAPESSVLRAGEGALLADGRLVIGPVATLAGPTIARLAPEPVAVWRFDPPLRVGELNLPGVEKPPLTGFDGSAGVSIEARFAGNPGFDWSRDRYGRHLLRIEPLDRFGKGRLMLAIQGQPLTTGDYGPLVGKPGYVGVAFGCNVGDYVELDVAFDGLDGRPTIKQFLDGPHQIVGSYDAATGIAAVYFDGREIGRARVADPGTPVMVADLPVWIGSLDRVGPFEGSIERVSVYRGALVPSVEPQTHDPDAPDPVGAPSPDADP